MFFWALCAFSITSKWMVTRDLFSELLFSIHALPKWYDLKDTNPLAAKRILCKPCFVARPLVCCSPDVIQIEAEATLQGLGESLYRDLAAAAGDWGFDLEDIKTGGKEGREFTGKIHVWVGSEDRLAPPALARYAARVVPAVEVHEVPGAGHYFVYGSESLPEKILSDLLGLADAQEIAAKEAEAAAAKYA